MNLARILVCLILNVAVISLELIGTQLTRAFSACLNSMNPTPSVCGAPSWVWPEYNISSPVARRNWPVWVHLVSAIPSTLMLYLLISIAIMDVFPCSYIVLTFQVAICVCCFRERRIGRAGSRFCWLSLLGVISSDEPLPTRQRDVCLVLLCFCNNIIVTWKAKTDNNALPFNGKNRRFSIRLTSV